MSGHAAVKTSYVPSVSSSDREHDCSVNCKGDGAATQTGDCGVDVLFSHMTTTFPNSVEVVQFALFEVFFFIFREVFLGCGLAAWTCRVAIHSARSVQTCSSTPYLSFHRPLQHGIVTKYHYCVVRNCFPKF